MLPFLLAFQLAQAPSPMVESTRAHERQERQTVPGERLKTPFGEILLPPDGHVHELAIHFHGEPWLVEQSIRHVKKHAAILAVQLGAGSRVYAEPFRDPAAFQQILAILARPVKSIYLSGFSAGYGAVREILKQPQNAARVTGVILLDGLHAGYEEPQDQRRPLAEDLAPFVPYGERAARKDAHLLILHSEIFPAAYASTTESTDWLLAQWRMKRKAVLHWGPLGMQILSDARRGDLRVIGFAGNSAPDHVDHLHALPWAFKHMH
jgi:hypothetical protein